MTINHSDNKSEEVVLSMSDKENGRTTNDLSSSVSQSKTERTIVQLSALLNSTYAAEELKSSWYREANTNLSAEPKLCDLHTVLQSGRSITRGQQQPTRGIPLWIVVRMCKASWHIDGTWPLTGCDEVIDEEERGQGKTWKSIHPSSQIIKVPQQLQSSDLEAIENKGPPIRMEKTADEIAEAYRKRGIFVEDAPTRSNNQDDEDDW